MKVITVGNFKPQKNMMDTARVAHLVHDLDKNVRFTFVGDGPDRSLVESFCKHMDLPVTFLGWVNDPRPLLREHDCFLLTSLWEGLPRALVEAAAEGLPSVCYDTNGCGEVCINGNTGFLVPQGNLLMATASLLVLKQNPVSRYAMGLRARLRVAVEFDIDKMVRDQENLYQAAWQAAGK